MGQTGCAVRAKGCPKQGKRNIKMQLEEQNRLPKGTPNDELVWRRVLIRNVWEESLSNACVCAPRSPEHRRIRLLADRERYGFPFFFGAKTSQGRTLALCIRCTSSPRHVHRHAQAHSKKHTETQTVVGPGNASQGCPAAAAPTLAGDDRDILEHHPGKRRLLGLLCGQHMEARFREDAS